MLWYFNSIPHEFTFCIGDMLPLGAVWEYLSIMDYEFLNRISRVLYFYSQLGYYDIMKVNSRCQNICYQWDLLKDLTENYKIKLQVFHYHD